MRRVHAAAKGEAQRIVANGRLDASWVTFGDSLFAAVQKDRTSARWKTFFSEAVTVFVKQALDRQIRTVRGWLASTSEAALEPHRASLTKWADAAAAAQVKTAAWLLCEERCGSNESPWRSRS